MDVPRPIPMDQLKPALTDAEGRLRDLRHRLLKTRFVMRLLIELDLVVLSAAGHVGPNDGD
jgi:hypothetical protein